MTIAHIYTDGASKVIGPRGPKQVQVGGWGVHALYRGEVHERSGHEHGATNNRMELMAIRHGVLLAQESWRSVERVMLYSDSTYCVNALVKWHFNWRRNGWMTAGGTPVQNRELIEEIIANIPGNVTFRWVKGHSKIPGNERADALATEARRFLEESLQC